MAPRFTTRFRAALAVVATILIVAPLALTATPVPAVAASSGSPHVELLAQSTTVGATASGLSPFTLTLGVTGAASDRLRVSTRLFGALSTRSGFVSALSASGPSQQIDATDPVPFSCLSPSKLGGATLAIDVRASSTTPVPAARPCPDGPSMTPSFTLSCTIGSGGCNGVYPVQVEVTSAGTVVARFVTFLTYVEHPAETPLRFTPVLALPSTPHGVLVLSHAVRTNASIALDLNPSPIVAQHLSTMSSGRESLSSLGAALSDASSNHEVVAAPYAPVDPGTLDASGLTGAVRRQMARGRQILTATGLGEGSHAAGWVASTPTSEATMNSLSNEGFRRAIIPDASLSQPTAESLNWGEPFTTTPGTSSITAMAVDPLLSSQLAGGSDPVLSAERLLADLAFLHFERPSLSLPLGVIAVTPSGWTPSPAFLATLFSGLDGNPLIVASTASSQFDTLRVGSNENPTSRSLATTGPGAAWPSAQVNQLAGEQVRQASFTSAVVNDPSLVSSLHDQLLVTESDQLSTSGRQVALNEATRALDDQISTVAFGGAEITLTSLKGSIPITLTKTAPYSLRGILELKSTHLRFPRGERSTVLLDHPTQSIRISAVAETTGDLPFTATFLTPRGALTIARQKVVVHTTQTSVVAIILTIGAALVLIAWWLRTSSKKPRRRHRARS